MKPNTPLNKGQHSPRPHSKVAQAIPASPCARKCRQLDRQVIAIKREMVREFGTAISGQSHLLNSALNEAEAIAWQTGYPHLLFPVLAEEKASAVTRWAARQRSVLRATRQISFTA
jgi:hypothetical protein